ncbi:MAG: hypothetical protein QM731_27495 [Chitinophagaceae bacterium]
MKRSFFIITLITVCIAIISCSKKSGNEPDPATGGNEELSKALLRRITMNPGTDVDGTFQYNNDSTVSHIRYTSPLVSTLVNFHYSSPKWIDFIEDTRTNDQADYFNDLKGRVHTILYSNPISDISYQCEFVYAGAGKLTEMRFYWVENSIPSLKYINAYEYNSDGLLIKVTSTDSNWNTIEYTLSEYSDPCNFNPWLFIEPARLVDLYELLNYPVLSSQNRLPGKVIKSTSAGVERIIVQQFTIEKGRLNKVKVSNKFPGAIGLDNTYDMNLYY